MQAGTYKFDRVEFAGSLGDLGTLLPLSVALIVITGLSTTSVLLMIGIFYVICGWYYKLPIPVQPLKVVSAIAIAYPEKITIPVIGAAGIIFGLTMLLFALTGFIDWLSKFFTRPVVRGIQLGLGLILMNKGITFILRPELIINNPESAVCFGGIQINLIMGFIGFGIALFLLTNKRFPAALVVVFSGILMGVLFGSLNHVSFLFGPTQVALCRPGIDDFLNAFIFLVIPQIPLTLGNAVIGTADTCYSFFGKGELTKRVSYRSLATSMGFTNLFAGILGAMPMCHGAGGLAAHYRFGARTGGSNMMIGAVFLIMGLAFGKIGISLLSSIPNSILGILLLFAGIELALLIKDIKEKNDLFVAILIAGIGFATTNMAIAFFVGIFVMHLIKWRNINF